MAPGDGVPPLAEPLAVGAPELEAPALGPPGAADAVPALGTGVQVGAAEPAPQPATARARARAAAARTALRPRAARAWCWGVRGGSVLLAATMVQP
ncbi:hypothetical protein SAT01_33060 [Sinomonas atrocyanea]|nr:hypothetical protein SAT01_33060 [Sinomonas atrocyanea]GGG73151.1 hypothetical protein GCM10007172_27110 [Sinomonas atrocyanea]